MLHPEKTRLIEFGRFAAERRKRRGLGKPETLNSWASPSSAARLAPGQIPDQTENSAGPHAGEAQEVIKESAAAHAPADSRTREVAVVRVVERLLNYHAVPTNVRALAGIPN